MSTMSAFYFGETLQARSTLALSVALIKFPINLSSEAISARVTPPITKALYLSIFSSNILIALSSAPSISSAFSSLITYLSIFSSSARSNPAEIPILMAVPILSPVKTQTLIPAFFMNSIVSLTSS